MGTAERKLREKERRRQDILDTAEQLFFEQGYDTVTMDSLAQQTELSKGTLYLYFRNKEELFLGINARAKKLLRQLMEQALDPQDNGLQQVLKLGQAYIQFARDYRNYYQMTLHCFALETEQQALSPHAEEAHYHGEKSFEILIAALLKGQADGSIAADLNARSAAVVLWGQLNGLMQVLEIKGVYFQQKLQLSSEEMIKACFALSERMLQA